VSLAAWSKWNASEAHLELEERPRLRRITEEDEEDEVELAARRRVILAEDDPEMRLLLSAALEREGFDVVAVKDGIALMDAIRASLEESIEPRLIVTDVSMPRCSGLRAISTLRRMHLEIPTLLITAFGDEETHDQAIRLGAAILDKPFDIYRFRRIAAGISSG
jgi:DNA-binding response OmpR family regulator